MRIADCGLRIADFKRQLFLATDFNDLADTRKKHIELFCLSAKNTPYQYLWYSYDADVLYINLKKPSHATDSELTDDDVVVLTMTREGYTLKYNYSPRRRCSLCE